MTNETAQAIYAAGLAAWQALVIRLNNTDTSDPTQAVWVKQAREVKAALDAALESADEDTRQQVTA